MLRKFFDLNQLLATLSLVMSCLFMTSLISSCKDIDVDADERVAHVAQTMVKEDILKDREIARKISSTNLFVSVTTSPARIEHLDLVLRTIDLAFVEKILLILPETFRGQKYVIPDHIRYFPKLKIIRIRNDRGPVSKLLGSIELTNIYEGREVAEKVVKDPENFILTIDDDIAYPSGMVGQLLKAAIQNPGVVAASANPLSFWEIDRNNLWPESAPEPSCGSQALSRCDVIEGFGGVIYRVGDVQHSMSDILTLAAASKDCFASDDLAISFVLARNNVSRFKLSNGYISVPFPYSFGFGEDALHRGAGLEEKSRVDMNASKYARCFDAATKLFTR